MLEMVFPGSCCLLVGSGADLAQGFLSPVLDATMLLEPMIQSLQGRVKEDWGKTF